MKSNIRQTISPVDGSVYVEFELTPANEIDATLDRAVRAQEVWKHVPISERAAICHRAADRMISRADQLALELTWQMGRPILHSPLEIRRGFAERARYMIDVAGRALADVVPEPEPGFRRFIRREPVGVVLVLAPWNYPYLTSVNAVIPALMAGNSVILKVSQQTPHVAVRYAEAFQDAGLPDHVFQHLQAGHDEVAGMIADRRVNFVAFTGSVEGGRAVQRSAAQQFAATNLELGGKDPAYVRPDAPLAPTVANIVDGAFFNSGQSCCAVERIYVHRDVYARFIDEFVARTREYRLGNPLTPDTTLGPMVRTSAADLVRAHVADALARGARALIDPSDFPAARPGTPYLAPQVLVGVDHSMRVMSEETFGPVVGVMAVTDDDEAVELMNDSRYGLTASIWTGDAEAAVRIGDRVDTGTWFMNRCDYLDPALAWTGVKDSGRGCSLSSLGYEALTRPKSFHMRAKL